ERVGIDRVRGGGGGDEGKSLQEFLALRPYAAGSKVAIISRAERLTEQAANCMLKVLEEPPAGSHIILCAAHPDRLPTTVLSRCASYSLGTVPRVDIAAWLQREHGIESTLVETVALLSAGRPGRALRLAREPGALRSEVEALETFLGAGGEGVLGALRVAGALAPGPGQEGRDRALVQLAVWAAFLRDVACFSEGLPELAAWTSARAALERWAEVLPSWRVVEMIGRCVTAAEEIASYAFPRLCYDVLMLDIFAREPAPPRLIDFRLSATLPGMATAPAAREKSGVSGGGGRRAPRRSR
ncbi:MAG TPA: hypothetical protein VE219_01295, partial [Candidatus Sulfotelmatobacter sp.]|nr:hypothetical protein [Candidatus Sulfotelmatobacter sp.]